MSANLPSWYVNQYSTNINLLLQQKGSLLRNTVGQGTYVGKQASPVDQIGAISANRVTSRFSPMARVDAPLTRRWVFPVDYDLPQMIDSFDLLRLLTDPKSAYTQNAMYAMGRAMDDEVVAAYFGTAKVGVDGATDQTFGTTTTATAGGRNVAVAFGAAAATNLTVAKLREAKRALLQFQVDPDDQMYCVVNAKAADSLLSEAQIVSTDFNNTAVLVDGKVNRFMGINFIYCERLTLGTDDAAGTSTAVPVYVQSAMHLGMWNDITTDISQRKDVQGLPWQAYAYGTFGATRLEENRIIRVWAR